MSDLEKIVTSSPVPCEGYAVITDMSHITIAEKTEIEHHHHKGVGIATVVDGIQGFASTNRVESLESVYNLSVKFAHHGSCPRVLPEPQSPALVKGCYDPWIAEAAPEDLLELADTILTMVPDSCTVNDVTISLKKQAVRIINSNGVDVCARGTSAVIDIIVQEKNAVFYSYYYSRTKELDWPLKEEIEQWRSWPQKTVDISPGKATVILSPAAFSQILDSVLTPVLCGDGPDIDNAQISICDDGTLPEGMGTFPFDAEGVPQQKTVLLKKGEVSHLYDTTMGDMSGQKSTGNAVRQSFEESPYVYVTNLVVEPVEKTEELIKDTKDGILVNNILGGYIAHPPSGGFLCTISPGYRIQKGEIVGIVSPKTMEGTLSALLQSVPGDDTRAVDRYRTPSTQVAVDIYS